MKNNSKWKILIAVIIAAVAVVFIPIYIFVLADAGDDGKYKVTGQKIVAMEDGTEGFDADDTAGNDSSKYNNVVRTFDDISYRVNYQLIKRDSDAGNDIDGREIQVEILIPTSYSAILTHDDEAPIGIYPGSSDVTVTSKFGTEYYYATFNVAPTALDTDSTFEFALKNINTDDISSHNSIKPLVFLRETTDQTDKSILDDSVTTLPADIACDIAATEQREASSNCNVTLSGKSSSDVVLNDIAVNMYVGTPKVTATETKRIPVGLLVGLKNQANGKGIKGLTVPSQVSFVVVNGDASKLSFVENSLDDYSQALGTDDYLIKIGTDQMPSIANGTVSGTLTGNNMLNVAITNITTNPIGNLSGYNYFASEYFVVELPKRGDYDYADINVSLTSDKNNSSGQQSSVVISDSYNLVLGDYNTKIDVYDKSATGTNPDSQHAYGKANINYNGEYTLKVDFSYDSANSQGDGLTSLTNYIKIDNTALKLITNTDNKSYAFIPQETTTQGSIAPDTDANGPKVYFGFGEWNANYFDIASNAPSGCPASLDNLTKEQIMNLYGGPCIVEKSTLQWARSPEETEDINGQPIDSSMRAMIVKSTFVTTSTQTNYIVPGSGGTLELYGTVINNPSVANNVYQVVTSATAYGKDATDFRYLGNQSISGEAFLTNANNFTKTVYDFTNRGVSALNNNLCSNQVCAVTGTSIITSGLKATRPILTSHKTSNLDTRNVDFYNYPFALKVNANSIKNDTINVDKAYVDIYLPSYMTILDNYGGDEPLEYTVEDTTLSSINSKFNFDVDAPVQDENYKVYHYQLDSSSVADFVVYVDIDQINTPTYVEPWVIAAVDFEGSKTNEDDEQVVSYTFRPITSDAERAARARVNIHNSSPIISRGTTSPRYIEKNGTYTYNMFAYNHSGTLVTNGYAYPTADLYYVLPYDGNTSDASMTSKVGTTKYKVNFTEESINGITNISDYKFYYATTGVPANIIDDEISTDTEPAAIWNLWEDPTEPVANVVAVKVVKQSPFAPGEYFGTTNGLTVNVETVGSTDTNIFYNTATLLVSNPSNYECDYTADPSDEDYDPEYCEKAMHTKGNFITSTSVTSVYSREISGLVFDDADYNGIFSSEEPRMKDIAVTLYKIDTLPENYDPTDPTTYVKDSDTPVSTTVTGANGNYYFGGLAAGNYYVRFTFDNEKYNVADYGRTSEYIPNSEANNSKALLLPNTNKAVTSVITFTEDYTDGKNIRKGINMGLTVKKEMAVKLNKFITEVIVTKNGKEEKYDYSDQNLSQVSITVINPKDTKVQVKYAFSIENTKYFPGYVGLLVDSMPAGMTFNPELEENKNWAIYDNTLYYNGLSGKLLLPGEKQYFKLTLDLELKEAGTYRNVITAKDLTILGSDLPIYDFGGSTTPQTNNAENQGTGDLGGE